MLLYIMVNKCDTWSGNDVADEDYEVWDKCHMFVL